MMHGDNGCADDLVFAQWLDGELEPVRAELLYVHLETCATCRQRLDAANQAKRLCEEQLGAEDEQCRDVSDEALARVRCVLHDQLQVPRRARAWLRPLALVAAVFAVALVIRVGQWAPPVQASGERIIAAAALSEQSWAWKPYHVRRRVLAVDFVGSRIISDGRYRVVSWQWNSARGVATISKRFNQANQLVAANWRDFDGTQVHYLAGRTVPIELIPSTRELRADGARLSKPQRDALHAFLSRRDTQVDPTEQRRWFENWFTRSTAQDARGSTARRIESTRWGSVYYIRTDERFEPGPAGIARIVAENYISASDLMRRRARVAWHGWGGHVETQDTYWLSYDDSTTEEFEANTLAAMMAGRKARRWTAAEVAQREIESNARRLVPRKAQGT